MPKVSVIIPNYNHASYLDQRIVSVLNQTYGDFELIILDDRSTDNSRMVIEKYRSSSKISSIIFNEENSGSTFKQWQKGIALAKGEWIWIAESDDWCEPTFLSEMMYLAEKYPDSVLAYCQSIIFYNNAIINKTTSDYVETNVAGREWLVTNMIGNCPLENASMAVFKRSEALSIIDQITRFKQCGDWYFWCQMARKGSVAISGKYLNYFRKHSSNVTSSSWSKGYYFTEGAIIFNELKQQVNLMDTEIAVGLEKILNMLRWNKAIFSKDYYQDLQNTLISIHPKIANRILQEYKTTQTRVAIKQGIKKLFLPLRYVLSRIATL
jgi:glycosyltransferase involved in cell wall biosynthesis